MTKKRGLPKTGGRKKGTPNRLSSDLKQAILDAAMYEGNGEGMVGYLRHLARTNTSAFAGLLGKVLPLTIIGDSSKPIGIQISWPLPKTGLDE